MECRNKIVIIGLTGGAGSGKSTAASIFRSLGARIIDADRIGHDLLKKSSPCHERIVKAFGKEILRNGRIDRKSLGQWVFNNKAELVKLNGIVHPHILIAIRNKISKIKKTGFCGFIVIDAALLVQWGWHKKVDEVIVVAAPLKLRLQRLMAKGRTPDQAREIVASQLPAPRLKREADRIIVNDGSLTDLRKRVVNIHRVLAAKSITTKRIT